MESTTVKRERWRKTKLSRKQRREDRSMRTNKTTPSTQEPPPPPHSPPPPPPTPIVLSICPPGNLPATKHSMVAAILTSAFPLQESTNMAGTTRNIARLIPTKPKIPNAWKVAYQSGRKVHKNNGLYWNLHYLSDQISWQCLQKHVFVYLSWTKRSNKQQNYSDVFGLFASCLGWLFAWSIGRLIASMAFFLLSFFFFCFLIYLFFAHWSFFFFFFFFFFFYGQLVLMTYFYKIIRLSEYCNKDSREDEVIKEMEDINEV